MERREELAQEAQTAVSRCRQVWLTELKIAQKSCLRADRERRNVSLEDKRKQFSCVSLSSPLSPGSSRNGREKVAGKQEMGADWFVRPVWLILSSFPCADCFAGPWIHFSLFSHQRHHGYTVLLASFFSFHCRTLSKADCSLTQRQV